MDKNLSAAGFPGIDKILELIGKAEAEKERVIIAIDGKSGSGKSFLAGLLKVSMAAILSIWTISFSGHIKELPPGLRSRAAT